MTMMQWLTGPNGVLFSSTSVIVVLILMLFMSIKLYASYRNKVTYRWLIAAISLMMAKQAVLIGLAFSRQSLPPWIYLASSLLGIVSFIIINFVFMKLYTYRTAQLRSLPFLIMAGATGALAAAQYAVAPSGSGTSGEGLIVSFPLLDVYMIVVTLIILLATRVADLSPKYYTGLIVYFIGELARMADAYVFHGGQPWLLLLGLLLPIVYFSLMFMLLFEWVIERLMSTYQSSIVDGLTGLYNRRHFSSKADALLKGSKSMAIIFCDIDNFKRLNDTQGHLKADIVLKRVAEIIKEEASSIGSAGRYGGEELLACISTERVKPDVVAESIRKRIESETIVTVSVGFSTSKESGSVQEMVKQADEAMYYSKMNGKNRVSSFKSLPASAKNLG
ncbi:GGDEF domain-containing protein [Paenibacillus agaridevorans]|uniref:GGDEF domain-containing protein n=1 Tax=Paenibacillus agaridevorans TaxID=171404 RepID=A0A2R5ERR4_9BACL|nr:GGDEF domain-containing protein [Paenibacillus agaridevorans]GBG06074.1 GGDEF domain-containing protein [Paenibacillus agaridevorans]